MPAIRETAYELGRNGLYAASEDRLMRSTSINRLQEVSNAQSQGSAPFAGGDTATDASLESFGASSQPMSRKRSMGHGRLRGLASCVGGHT